MLNSIQRNSSGFDDSMTKADRDLLIITEKRSLAIIRM